MVKINVPETPPPEPNLKELERLRALKKKREAEKKQEKTDRWREEYWLNNPPYFDK